MTTLSKLRFKPQFNGMYAQVVFGNMFVGVGYNPNWKGNAGGYCGDGKVHWEVAYGVIGDENFTVISNARRQQVNTILRNISIKGRMEAANV